VKKYTLAAVNHDGTRSVGSASGPFEEHFEPAELGLLWKLDATTIRRIFQDEPGVLRIGKSNRRDGKRDYITLRIPKSVAERVWREKSR
jgi:hypothetical protein